MGLEEILQARRVLIIAAHQDDEVIGAGSLFPELGHRLSIVHVTHGAPLNLADSLNAGFSARPDYSRARFEESFAAAALANIGRRQFIRLGIGYQKSSLDLGEVTRRVLETIESVGPDTVLTHPYEGGHPDHDATAFAAHLAVAACGNRPRLWEFASYHAGLQPGTCQPQTFLGDAGAARMMSKSQKHLKQQMFACFASQKQVLEMFSPYVERFRLAPSYDFTQAPHAGRLYYEYFDWGMNGARFRDAALLCHSRFLASPTR